MDIPTTPAVLVSFINMKLRDSYSSIEELCEDMDLDKNALFQQLNEAGYTYSQEHKRFI